MKPKLGYLSIHHVPEGTYASEWTVHINGSVFEGRIQRAHDSEGWYEVLEEELVPNEAGGPPLRYQFTRHYKGEVEFVYDGPNENFHQFSLNNE